MRRKHFLRELDEGAVIYGFLMNSEEYANLARIETDHWYYSGKRELVRYWLGTTRPIQPSSLLLDCGAGTGLFAKEMEASCRVLVLDDHEESLALLRARFAPQQVIELSDGRIPIADASVDYVTALDVLEHVEADDGVVREFARVLKSGGVALVTVPAGMALWSDWDVALHHHRRYERLQLEALFPPQDWAIEHSNYTNVAAYPAVWALRRWRKCFPNRALGTRAEDRIPSPRINRLLRSLFVGMGKCRMPFPFGVSLILIARKRG
jgi:SAM-dependent methyltransferase